MNARPVPEGRKILAGGATTGIRPRKVRAPDGAQERWSGGFSRLLRGATAGGREPVVAPPANISAALRADGTGDSREGG